jgi:aminopeptidase N
LVGFATPTANLGRISHHLESHLHCLTRNHFLAHYGFSLITMPPMTPDTLQTINLADYAPPSFLIDTVDVDINFQRGEALVRAQLSVRRNPAVKTSNDSLVLDGEELELISIHLDGVLMASDRYRLGTGHLTLTDLPDTFCLETVTRIHPDSNTRLSGLYLSANGYFTQCEAQGFRRITWFQDRPDVMSRYTVTLHADKAALPQLLANGNPVASGDEEGGRHWAKWQDPFPKALFANRVGGSLGEPHVADTGR